MAKGFDIIRNYVIDAVDVKHLVVDQEILRINLEDVLDKQLGRTHTIFAIAAIAHGHELFNIQT